MNTPKPRDPKVLMRALTRVHIRVHTEVLEACGCACWGVWEANVRASAGTCIWGTQGVRARFLAGAQVSGRATESTSASGDSFSPVSITHPHGKVDTPKSHHNARKWALTRRNSGSHTYHHTPSRNSGQEVAATGLKNLSDSKPAK
ncbi:hypothetical protein CRG98_021892 [Punica granatum]|uniref:Uncharacterized protein n=1 Tax=Punica granatum TaxID=22663 RepID=A0A2I0JN56_PUNGR|nr:hypothetical protein CRG98_021892 [Punica granatum]